MDYIIDSYAWVEYFLGSGKSEVMKRLLLNEKNLFFTVECCLAEIKGWALKNDRDFDKLFSELDLNSSKPFK